jgi:hypothetical protein
MSCTWKGWKCIPSNNHLARIHKTNHVNSKIGQMKELVCFYTMSLIHSMSSFSQHLSKKGKRKQLKRGKKTKKLATLDLNIHFDFPIHELSCKLLFCCPDQLVFFSKWCHVN